MDGVWTVDAMVALLRVPFRIIPVSVLFKIGPAFDLAALRTEIESLWLTRNIFVNVAFVVAILETGMVSLWPVWEMIPLYPGNGTLLFCDQVQEGPEDRALWAEVFVPYVVERFTPSDRDYRSAFPFLDLHPVVVPTVKRLAKLYHSQKPVSVRHSQNT